METEFVNIGINEEFEWQGLTLKKVNSNNGVNEDITLEFGDHVLVKRLIESNSLLDSKFQSRGRTYLTG